LTASGTNLFAGAEVGGGICLSTNNGTSWTAVNYGLDYSSVHALAISGKNVFAGTDGGGVYLSTNNGTRWTAINEGLTSSSIQALAINETYIFAGTHGASVWKRPLSDFTDVMEDVNNLPVEFKLSQNYPNPFNPGTVISYSIPSSSNIKLIVYNTMGQTIRILENGFKSAGIYSINFNASNLPSGIYFYRLEAEHFSQVKKMILIK
jgi:hypothetical protein